MREALWESGAVGAALDSLLLANRFGLPEVRFAFSGAAEPYLVRVPIYQVGSATPSVGHQMR
jgi:hypothetical protein